MTGTGAPLQGSLNSTPAMGAIAVMRSASRHARSDDICAPFDMPTEKTFAVSMHRIASRWSSRSLMNVTS